jgi:hypothetical protein
MDGWMEGDRQTERQRETEGDRGRQRETKRETERDRERQRETERDRDRQRQTDRGIIRISDKKEKLTKCSRTDLAG